MTDFELSLGVNPDGAERGVNSIVEALDKLEKKADSTIDKFDRLSNKTTGKSLGENITRHVRSANRELATLQTQLTRITNLNKIISFGVDVSKVKAEIDKLAVFSIDAIVKADTVEAIKDIDKLKDKTVDIKVNADLSTFKKDLKEIEDKVVPIKTKFITGDISDVQKEVDSKTVDVKIKADLSTFRKDLKSLDNSTVSVKTKFVVGDLSDVQETLNNKELAVKIRPNVTYLKNEAKKILANEKLTIDVDAIKLTQKAIADVKKQLSGSVTGNLVLTVGTETLANVYEKLKDTKVYLQAVLKKQVQTSAAKKALKKMDFEISVKGMTLAKDSLTEFKERIKAVRVPIKTSVESSEVIKKLKERLHSARFTINVSKIDINSEELKRIRKLLGDIGDTDVGKVDNSVKKLNKTTKETYHSATKLRDAFIALSYTFQSLSPTEVIRYYVELSDKYTDMSNRLKVLGASNEEAAVRMVQFKDAAIDARASLDGYVDVFAKVQRANNQLNMTQLELIQLTTTVSQAVAMSGASAQGAQGALMQFGQALSGNFRAAAQEMNSMIEQTPALVKYMAEGLTAMGHLGEVTMGNIKKFASEGLITAKDVSKAMILISSKVRLDMESAQLTIAQGWQAVTDSVTVYIGEINNASGASKFIADTLQDLAKSLKFSQEEFDALIIGVGTFSAILGGVGVLFLAQFALIPLAIAGASAAIAYFFDDLKYYFNALPAMIGDVWDNGSFTAIGENVMSQITEGMSVGFSWLLDKTKSMASEFYNDSLWGTVIREPILRMRIAWERDWSGFIGDAIVGTANFIAKAVTFLGDGIVSLINGTFSGLGNLIVDVFNSATDSAFGDVSHMMGLLITRFGLDLANNVKEKVLPALYTLRDISFTVFSFFEHGWKKMTSVFTEEDYDFTGNLQADFDAITGLTKKNIAALKVETEKTRKEIEATHEAFMMSVAERGIARREEGQKVADALQLELDKLRELQGEGLVRANVLKSQKTYLENLNSITDAVEEQLSAIKTKATAESKAVEDELKGKALVVRQLEIADKAKADSVAVLKKYKAQLELEQTALESLVETESGYQSALDITNRELARIKVLIKDTTEVSEVLGDTTDDNTDKTKEWDKALKGISSTLDKMMPEQSIYVKYLNEMADGTNALTLAANQAVQGHQESIDYLAKLGLTVGDVTGKTDKYTKTLNDYSMEQSGATDVVEEIKEAYLDYQVAMGLVSEKEAARISTAGELKAAENALKVAVEASGMSAAEAAKFLEFFRNELDGTNDSAIAAKKALEETANSIADTFMDGFEAAMEGFESFKDWLLDSLKKLALDIMKEKIVVPIVGEIMDIGGSGGSSGVLGNLGSIGNFLSDPMGSISSIGTAITDFAAFGTTGTAATGSLSAGAGGSYAADLIGMSEAGGAASAAGAGVMGSAMSVASAVPYAAAIYMLGDALFGSRPQSEYNSQWNLGSNESGFVRNDSAAQASVDLGVSLTNLSAAFTTLAEDSVGLSSDFGTLGININKPDVSGTPNALYIEHLDEAGKHIATVFSETLVKEPIDPYKDVPMRDRSFGDNSYDWTTKDEEFENHFTDFEAQKSRAQDAISQYLVDVFEIPEDVMGDLFSQVANYANDTGQTIDALGGQWQIAQEILSAYQLYGTALEDSGLILGDTAAQIGARLLTLSTIASESDIDLNTALTNYANYFGTSKDLVQESIDQIQELGQTMPATREEFKKFVEVTSDGDIALAYMQNAEAHDAYYTALEANRGSVNELYEEYYGRIGTEEELAWWSKVLTEGYYDLNDAQEMISESTPALTKTFNELLNELTPASVEAAEVSRAVGQLSEVFGVSLGTTEDLYNAMLSFKASGGVVTQSLNDLISTAIGGLDSSLDSVGDSLDDVSTTVSNVSTSVSNSMSALSKSLASFNSTVANLDFATANQDILYGGYTKDTSTAQQALDLIFSPDSGIAYTATSVPWKALSTAVSEGFDSFTLKTPSEEMFDSFLQETRGISLDKDSIGAASKYTRGGGRYYGYSTIDYLDGDNTGNVYAEGSKEYDFVNQYAGNYDYRQELGQEFADWQIAQAIKPILPYIEQDIADAITNEFGDGLSGLDLTGITAPYIAEIISGNKTIADASKDIVDSLSESVNSVQSLEDKYNVGLTTERINELGVSLAAAGKNADILLPYMIDNSKYIKELADKFNYLGIVFSDFEIDALSDIAGGFEELGNLIDNYYLNTDFFSQDIIDGYVLQDFVKSIKSLGLEVPTTTEGFNDLVEANKGVNETYVELLKLAPKATKVFAALNNELSTIASTTDDVFSTFSDAVDDMISSVNDKYEIDQSHISNALDSVATSLETLKDIRDSLDDALKVQTNTSESMSFIRRQNSISSLQTLATMSLGQQVVSADGSTSTTGRVLPTKEVLDDLIAVVNSDAEGFYSSRNDYMRDQIKARTALKTIRDSVGEQLTGEEKTHKYLSDSLEALETNRKSNVASLEALRVHYAGVIEDMRDNVTGEIKWLNSEVVDGFVELNNSTKYNLVSLRDGITGELIEAKVTASSDIDNLKNILSGDLSLVTAASNDNTITLMDSITGDFVTLSSESSEDITTLKESLVGQLVTSTNTTGVDLVKVETGISTSLGEVKTGLVTSLELLAGGSDIGKVVTATGLLETAIVDEATLRGIESDFDFSGGSTLQAIVDAIEGLELIVPEPPQTLPSGSLGGSTTSNGRTSTDIINDAGDVIGIVDAAPKEPPPSQIAPPPPATKIPSILDTIVNKASSLGLTGAQIEGFKKQYLDPNGLGATELFGVLGNMDYGQNYSQNMTTAEFIKHKLTEIDYSEGQVNAALEAFENGDANLMDVLGAAGNWDYIQHVVKGSGVAAFATGGTHTGGFRTVGERGRELEFTAPSHIFSKAQTDSLMDTSGIEERLEQLEETIKSGLFAVAKNTQKTSKQLDRWDGDGMPEVRTI